MAGMISFMSTSVFLGHLVGNLPAMPVGIFVCSRNGDALVTALTHDGRRDLGRLSGARALELLVVFGGERFSCPWHDRLSPLITFILGLDKHGPQPVHFDHQAR